MNVTAVVVTYASAGEIEGCLEPLLAAGAHVVVVDNASPDGTAALVRERFPQVALIANEANRGFGAGVNQGVELARTPYVAVVNPDARLPEADLATLVRFLAENADVAVTSPVLRGPDGARQRTGARQPRLSDLACVAVPQLGRFLPSYTTGGYAPELYDRGEPFDVEAVIGACMVFRTDAFRAVGGFDEAFFLYKEEEDLCLRIRQAGGRVIYEPAAEVVHVGSVVAGRDPQRLAESVARYRAKHVPPLRGRLLGALYTHVTRRI
jgi:GT2 family glycosyltransferase